MQRLISLFLTVLLVFPHQVVLATSLEFPPMFEPGYRPAANSDEGGFWYKVGKMEEQVKASPYLVREEPLNKYVSDIVCQLAGDYCSDIRVYIVENPHFNAFMAPNGMMVVWSGLLLRVDNEAQLAAVLGHEIAHYLRAHQISQWRKLRDSAPIAMMFDMFLTGGLATLAIAGSSASFGRDQELEADTIGLELMAKNGYQLDAATSLWRYVQSESDADKSRSSRGGFFASHPSPKKRIEKLDQRATELSVMMSSQEDLYHQRYVDQIAPHYRSFMRNHLGLQEYEQTVELLKKHTEMGFHKSYIDFFTGELYRLRKTEGDRSKAIEAYRQSIQHKTAPVEAYRELAYLHLKEKEKDKAKMFFTQYLEKAPEASDREMVRFYINSLGNNNE